MNSLANGLQVREITPDDLRSSAKGLLDKGGRLMYATGVDKGVAGIRVDYYFGFDHLEPGCHTILRTFLDRENPVLKSVTTLTPQADWSEREMIEFLGVRAEEHPDPRHLWLPLNWEQMHTDEAAPEKKPQSIQASDHITTMPVSTIPYGPYHPAFIESNYFKMAVEDEVVKKADLKLGFNHRSIIKLMERRDYYKDIYLAERVCGLCNAHHALSFCLAVENIGQVTVPKRADIIRTMICEMERIQSHLMAIGILGDLVGYKTMLMQFLRIREDIQDSLELVSGQRVTHGLITLGGVRRDITPAQSNFVKRKLASLKKGVQTLYDEMLSNNVLIGRLKNVGVLPPEEAVRLGAVGPTARGSGQRLDVRKNTPYAYYENLDWDIVTDNGCDSLARVEVKMREALVSISIVEQCLEKLSTVPPEIITKLEELPCAEALGKTEPPRGELLYHVASNGTNTPEFVRIRVPTFMTAYIMLKLLHGSYVADVPAIMGSIDPCYSCTDRVTVHKDAKIVVRSREEK
ncbi:hydrogenase large subunit [Methanocella arvoryzae]